MISSLPAALTDSQLRASAVPIIVSAALPAGANAIGSVTVTGSVAVTGTFWQATQPISAASLPLPADAATETTLAALNAKVATCNTNAVTITDPLPIGTNTIGSVNISAALPAGSNAIGSVGIVGALPTGTNAIGFVSIGAALPAGGNVIGAVSQSGTWTVTGPLTDAQLRASPAPVTVAAPNVATGQVTCGTSATLIVDARSTRRRVTIICHSAANLFIGVSGVTTGTGLFMPQSVPMIFDTTAAIYGDSASSSVVSYLEVYD